MSCTITDNLYYYSSALAGQALTNRQVIAVPSADFYRISIGGNYRTLGVNPNITTAAYKLGIVATTDSAGQFTLVLPYGATESLPASPVMKWTIVLPDGRQIYGTVPSVAGPLTLNDLLTTHGWAFTTSTYVAPVTPGTLARGTATFTAASTFDVVFAGAPFASAAYGIRLTPSIDTNTSEPPAVGWSSKTTTGFTINVSGVFTGSVDWEAVL